MAGRFWVKRLEDVPLVPTDDPADFDWYPIQHHLWIGAFGVNAEVVVTVAWDISWYQYRISPDSDNPVRLEGRGHDPAELEGSATDWNAQMDDAGRILPDIARL